MRLHIARDDMYVPSSIDIALGHYPDWEQDIKFGYNEDVGTAAFDTIWAFSAKYVPLQSAVAFEIVSSSTDDTAAGTGARTVQMTLLDATLTEQTVTATLNGTTAVPITGTYFACNRSKVLTIGVNAGSSNVGNISVRTAGGGAVHAYIPAGTGQTQQAMIRVPKNKLCLVDGYRIGVQSGKTVNFRGVIREGVLDAAGNPTGAIGPYRAVVSEFGIQGNFTVDPKNWRVAGPGSFLSSEAIGITQSASVSCNFDYLYHKYK